MSYDDDPRFSATMVFTIAGALLVFALIVGLQAMFHVVEQAERERKWEGDFPTETEVLETKQLEQLSEYRWVDQKRGRVAVPIERAMELTVRDAAAGRTWTPDIPKKPVTGDGAAEKGGAAAEGDTAKKEAQP